MKLYIKRLNKGVNATADFDKTTGVFTVLKGSHVSDTIAYSEKFRRGANTIKKYRSIYVEDGVVTRDVEFKSSSTAANFVTGVSSNGLITWKDENGNTLKAILAREA